jgi:hypothetical protein
VDQEACWASIRGAPVLGARCGVILGLHLAALLAERLAILTERFPSSMDFELLFDSPKRITTPAVRSLPMYGYASALALPTHANHCPFVLAVLPITHAHSYPSICLVHAIDSTT